MLLNFIGIQMEPTKPQPKPSNWIGRTPLDGLIAQLRETKNVVTQSVLIDCIVDRLKRGEYD